MRIIAGALGGRKLHAPRGKSTRPTADRVKEALFNILGAPRARDGRRFRALDLYAGSGALGLEAISRGADEAVLIEQDEAAALAAERNVSDLAVGDRVRVIRGDVGMALRRLDGAFDWVFVDPPYEGGFLDRALRLLGGSKTVADEGTVIAEHAASDAPGDRFGRLLRDDLRRYGQTALSFYRPAVEPAP
ncbi:MAG: 16S rRNA (guanine(966)-N(2))-methyltransferase RsmD [Myxococcales bacterium]|nr:16S rRNA (guanine(966)-N(2))-methyltransferase RsmD [Myxococcales bacterium]